MATDQRDEILQQQCPTVMVPKFGKFESLQENGHRFLVASDGLWLELRRPWLYVRKPIAMQDVVQIPCGQLTEAMSTSWDHDERIAEHLERFEREAHAALPNEHAAWLVWNDRDNTLEYRPCEILEATPGSLSYVRPQCEAHEHACVDIHSHGKLQPFFSDTDDDDDRGEVKFAIVLGNLGCDYESTRVTTRMCVLGLFLYPGVCRNCGELFVNPDLDDEWPEPDLCHFCAARDK